MEQLDEQINKNELIDFQIYLNNQFKMYSIELHDNYKLFNQLVNNYEENLAKVLILKQKTIMKDFFLEINLQMTYLLQIFDRVNNITIKNHIINRIKKHKERNLQIAKYYLNE